MDKDLIVELLKDYCKFTDLDRMRFLINFSPKSTREEITNYVLNNIDKFTPLAMRYLREIEWKYEFFAGWPNPISQRGKS